MIMKIFNKLAMAFALVAAGKGFMYNIRKSNDKFERYLSLVNASPHEIAKAKFPSHTLGECNPECASKFKQLALTEACETAWIDNCDIMKSIESTYNELSGQLSIARLLEKLPL